jgi:soluble lytic murein transglycosylase
MGSAELGALLQEYRGCHIMTFAGYNAGRGRVRQWMKLYGDPRDPNVDPIDWVERIPFAETRNYVQRVMENYQVYKARLGQKTDIEQDLIHGRG